eukprot:887353-Rhodomonas_salina.3
MASMSQRLAKVDSRVSALPGYTCVPSFWAQDVPREPGALEYLGTDAVPGGTRVPGYRADPWRPRFWSELP